MANTKIWDHNVLPQEAQMILKQAAIRIKGDRASEVSERVDEAIAKVRKIHPEYFRNE